MRHLFGGSPSDYAMERVGFQLLLRPQAVGTVWDALTGGTQITDLTTLTGTPATTVTADSDGAVSFYGPDGVTSLYVDFGYGRRYAMAAIDTGAILDDFVAQGGEPGGWAVLDGSGHIDSSQFPAQLDWIIVRTYGALGNGIADDTLAIQAAIDACPVGGVVYFPRGVYKTTATLDWKNGVTLLGSHSNLMVGPGMTNDDYPCYIQPVAPFTGTSVLRIIGEDDGVHPAISGEQRMMNLMLDGSLLSGSTIDGLFAKGNVQNVVLDNVCIRQMPNNGIICGTNTAGELPYSWRLHHVMVDNCHANGMVWDKHTDLTLNDCQVIGCWAQGIVLTNCANAQLSLCRTEWNGSHGYRITGNWGNWAGSGGMQMTSCSTDRNGQYGILIDATGNGPMLLSGLQLRRDGRNGGTGGGGYAGLAVTSNGVPVVIAGVVCYPGSDDSGGAGNSPDYGIKLDTATDVQIDGGILHAQVQGLYQTGTNTRCYIGPNVSTVAGATTATGRAQLAARIGQVQADALTVSGTIRAAFLKTTSSTEHAVTVYQAGTSGVDTASALNIICDNPQSSTIQVTGSENNRGTIKVTHRNDSGTVNGDANAAALSVDLTQDGAGGTAAQGLFMTSTDGGTTGRYITVRNGGTTNLFTVPAAGSVYTATGAFGQVQPINHGVQAWAFDPALALNSSLLTNGTVYLTKVHIPEAVTVTKLYWWVTAVGATPTAGQNKVGLYNAAGTLLASTVVDADISSTGVKTTTITGQNLTAGSFYWVAMVFNAATAPTIARATGSAGVANAVNLGLTSSTFRYATNGTSQTTLPATITPGSNVAAGFAGPWAAVGA